MWGVAALIGVGLIVTVILLITTKSARPTNKPGGKTLPFGWSKNPYTEPAIAQQIWQDRGHDGEPPKACFDPNGFAGAFAGPNAMTQAPMAAQFRICEPAWDPDTETFVTGPESLPDSFWTVPDGAPSMPQCSDLLNDSSGTMSTQDRRKACWQRLCGLPQQANEFSEGNLGSNECFLNYWNAERGGPTGWWTNIQQDKALNDSTATTLAFYLQQLKTAFANGTAGAFATAVKGMANNFKAGLGDSTHLKLAQSICANTGSASDLVTTGDKDGVPVIAAASDYMQAAFTACWNDAEADGLTLPLALCADIVLRPNPANFKIYGKNPLGVGADPGTTTGAGAGATAAARGEYNPYGIGTMTYKEWKEIWANVNCLHSQNVCFDCNGKVELDSLKPDAPCCDIATPDGCQGTPQGWCVRRNGFLYGVKGTSTTAMTAFFKANKSWMDETGRTATSGGLEPPNSNPASQQPAHGKHAVLTPDVAAALVCPHPPSNNSPTAPTAPSASQKAVAAAINKSRCNACLAAATTSAATATCKASAACKAVPSSSSS